MWELISQQFCLCGGLCGEQQQKTKTLSWCLRISLYICVYSADSCSAAIYLWLHSITSSSSSVRVEVSETFSLLLLVLPAETNIDTIWHLYSHNAALNCIKVKSLTSSHIMRPGLTRLYLEGGAGVKIMWPFKSGGRKKWVENSFNTTQSSSMKKWLSQFDAELDRSAQNPELDRVGPDLLNNMGSSWPLVVTTRNCRHRWESAGAWSMW